MSELKDLAKTLGQCLYAWGSDGAEVPTQPPEQPLPEAPLNPPVDPEPTPDPVPTPEPTPTPEPLPEPLPPDPEDYALEPIWSDKIAAGWYNYSWAPSKSISDDVHSGSAAIEADLDNWSALNLHNSAGLDAANFAGVEFWAKALRAGDSFTVYITSGTATLGTPIRVTPPTTWTKFRYLWSELGVPTVGRFSNVVFDGGASGQREPFRFDDIALLRRSTPAVPPPAPPMESAPATAGWLTLQGREFKTESGETWVGKGVNFHDTKQSNACASRTPSEMLPEMKRRIDFAASIGADFIRYCVHQDGGVINAGDEWWRVVKEFVTYCWSAHKIRVLFSFWREGTCEGFSQAPTAASIPAWKMVAKAFANCGHVLYGLCNEPESWAAADQDRARQGMIAAARAIREQEKALGSKPKIIALQGTAGWARNIEGWRDKIPADIGPVCLETHAYDKASEFQARFVNMSQSGYPIICGEYGPAVIQSQNAVSDYNNLQMAESAYWSSPADVQTLWPLLQANKIPSCAWALSVRSWPDLLKDNSNGGCGINMNLELTPWGEMLKGFFAAGN